MNTDIYKIIDMKESRGEPLIERNIFFGGLSFLLFLNKTIGLFNYLRTKRKYGWKNWKTKKPQSLESILKILIGAMLCKEISSLQQLMEKESASS